MMLAGRRNDDLAPPILHGLYFNGSALLLYLIAAISEACAVTKEPDYHNYNSWATSSI
ncbi:CKLF-like MARVEL transmembrane domain-containing protein 8 [Ophiophagus hannah]|uniref:CKLF-like MARVEL transmembrane domain-containing protein 8 n=1 Tax=Ophiophagus hannah TaxID=8665 RepID=V8NB57_OPHHA|nr:CKLF-like MARVEL transmembrane domain-containing protein 8 [Ophiophagus hannah]